MKTKIIIIAIVVLGACATQWEGENMRDAQAIAYSHLTPAQQKLKDKQIRLEQDIVTCSFLRFKSLSDMSMEDLRDIRRCKAEGLE